VLVEKLLFYDLTITIAAKAWLSYKEIEGALNVAGRIKEEGVELFLRKF
jgi:hypothetical protein